MKRLTNTALTAMAMLAPVIGHTQALEEVVVTATKRSQNVNDIPVAISVFTGTEIKDRGIISPQDIAFVTPGLTVEDAAQTGVPTYTLRGVGFQNSYAAASSTVGLYFDEVAVPYTVMSRGMLFDIDRVEVLKGPQGDLYGRNTTAGQINFISNRPSEEFEAGLTFGIGSYEKVQVEGFVSGSFSDSVRARFAASTVQSNEGWQESLTRPGDKLGEEDRTALRAMFDFDLGETAELSLNVRYVDDQSDNRANTAVGHRNPAYLPHDQYVLPGGQFVGQPVPWYSFGDNEAADWNNTSTNPITGEVLNVRPKRDNQLFGFSAKLNWDITDSISLTSITGYDDFERFEINDWDGTPGVDSSSLNGTDLTVFSQELRLSGSNDKISWIAGLYYSEDDLFEDYRYRFEDSPFAGGAVAFGGSPFSNFPIYDINTRYDQKSESIAVFGNLEWQIADAWRLTLGARFTDEERSWTGCTYDAGDGSLVSLWAGFFGASLAPGSCGTLDDTLDSPTNLAQALAAGTPNIAFHPFSRTIKDDRGMGRIAVDYQLGDDSLLFFSISNGFKSGGFNGANSNTTQQLAPYDAEVLTAYEAGFKATLLDSSMQFNGSVFFYDYKDKQESQAAITPVGAISGIGNVDQSEITGVELEVNWVPAEGWNLRFSGVYLDTKITEWLTPDRNTSEWPGPINYTDASGSNLPQAPELQITALVSKRWQLGSGGLDTAIDYSWSDETSFLPEERPESITDSYGVANVRIGYGPDSGKWRTLLFINNVTDEYYFTAAGGGGNATNIRSVGLPRTWGLSFEYNFGGS